MESIKNLKAAGYNKKNLTIITKALKQNKETFIETFDWAMKNDINTSLDRLIPVMCAKPQWAIAGQELTDLITRINKLNKYNDKVTMPQLKNSPCSAIGTSCYVEVNGDVYPCSGLMVLAGNAFKSSLDYIWNHSKVFNEFDSFKDNLKGSCSKCKQNKEKQCCGCRAIAFAIFHDPRAPDPHCPNYNIKDKWEPDYSFWQKETIANIKKSKTKK
jgi:radical SAM protein with 4Fe4S-binding SPASM domain